MSKFKFLAIIGSLVLSTLLTGCVGTIETGNVGVRKQFGKVQQEEVPAGIYTSFFSSVDEYTTKETYVGLQNLTPKAKDKLILKDLDVTIYYKTNPDKVAEFASSHAAMSARMQSEHFYRPGYVLIENMARGIVSDEVSSFDSLTLHQNRTDLEMAIKNALAAQLNKSDPGYFEITRVVVSSLLTDPSVEESIRKNIAMTNEIDTARKDVQKKLEEANAMTKTASALTPMLLQHEYIKAIDKCASNPGCTLFVGAPGNLNMTLPK